jgi:hypothetical protein
MAIRETNRYGNRHALEVGAVALAALADCATEGNGPQGWRALVNIGGGSERMRDAAEALEALARDRAIDGMGLERRAPWPALLAAPAPCDECRHFASVDESACSDCDRLYPVLPNLGDEALDQDSATDEPEAP